MCGSSIFEGVQGSWMDLSRLLAESIGDDNDTHDDDMTLMHHQRIIGAS